MSGVRSAGSSKMNNTKSMAELMKERVSKPKTKAPAYQWQELALQIIQELEVPKEKRNSTFQVCKKFSRQIVEKALSDTKELCQTGEKWKYFFKIVGK